MTILLKRTTWTREKPKSGRRPALSPDEQANVRRALRALRVLHGGAPKLAKLLGSSKTTVEHALSKRGVSAGLAVRAARLAGVSVDDVMAGRWPALGACPLCGRSGAK